IKIPMPNEKDKEQNALLLREEDLQGHLENGNKSAKPADQNAKTESKTETKSETKTEAAKGKDKDNMPSVTNLIYTDYLFFTLVHY
ncbi:hypothetical protein, partial [Salmonella enterica]|uniref:hypothetical protein n=1 Tax=Salmonella enterica TaxID=28901 RepID=UPI0020C5360C